MPELSVLVVGDTDRAEFRDARASLDGVGRVAAAPDLAAAVRILSEGDFAADVIVLAQAMPGQFSIDGVDRLRQQAPLARIVALLGSWCEGEVRSGRPLPGVIRVYAHQWPARAGRELGRLRDGAASAWALPATAGEDEHLLAQIDGPPPRCDGQIAIRSHSHAMHDCLAGACRRLGYTAVWLRPGNSTGWGGVNAALFDVAELCDDEYAQLTTLSDGFSPTPILALAGFPRPADTLRLMGSGATSVLSKPFLLRDFEWELARLLSPAPAFLG